MASEKTQAGAETPMDICPYWHQVSADFASVYPGGGYCTAGCHQRIKVMAAKTFDEICVLRYGGCEGYQRVREAEEEKARQAPENTRR
jgi:hypothetical protein